MALLNGLRIDLDGLHSLDGGNGRTSFSVMDKAELFGVERLSLVVHGRKSTRLEDLSDDEPGDSSGVSRECPR